MTLPRLSLFNSLRARLVAGLLMVGLIGAAGMGALTEIQRRSANDVLEDTTLATQARSLVRGMTFDARGHMVSLDIRQRWRAAYALRGAGFFTVFDPEGRAIARSSNLAAPLPRQPLAEGQTQSPLALIGAAQNLSLSARAPHGYVVVVSRSPPGVLDETSPETWTDFQPLVLLLGVLGLCVVAAWIVAAWSLRPLARASGEAALIGPERLHDRISLAGLPSEVVALASAVNGALDRVARAYDTERRFTADAAHALRTPVAVMDLRLQRAAATGGLDQGALRADLGQIAELVSGLLNLARAEQSDPPRGEINLARLVRETAAALQPTFDASDRVIMVEAPETLSLKADARRVRDMLEALIDNALRHGAGRVSVRLSAAGEGCVLVVEDQGRAFRRPCKRGCSTASTNATPIPPAPAWACRSCARPRGASAARRASWRRRRSRS